MPVNIRKYFVMSQLQSTQNKEKQNEVTESAVNSVSGSREPVGKRAVEYTPPALDGSTYLPEGRTQGQSSAQQKVQPTTTESTGSTTGSYVSESEYNDANVPTGTSNAVSESNDVSNSPSTSGVSGADDADDKDPERARYEELEKLLEPYHKLLGQIVAIQLKMEYFTEEDAPEYYAKLKTQLEQVEEEVENLAKIYKNEIEEYNKLFPKYKK